MSKRALGFISIFLLVVACSESLNIDKEDLGAPTITDFSPKSGIFGTRVRITGTYLKDMNKVTIGGVEVNFERVNNAEAMLITTAAVKGGKIVVTTPQGTAESEAAFTAEFVRPTLISYPNTGDLFSVVTFQGDNLDLVTEVSFGEAIAEIKEQSENKLAVAIPFIAGDDQVVDVSLKYPYGEAIETLVLEEKFTIIKVRPTQMQCDEGVTVGETFKITGKNLQVVERITVGEYEATIVSSTSEEIICSLPIDIESTIENNEVRVWYWKTYYNPVSTTFTIKIPPYYVWKNVTLYGPTHPNVNFFSGITGLSYTPCEFEANADKIHLAIYGSANGLNLGTLYPKDGGLLDKRWTCGGIQISGANGVPMRFRKLKESNEADAKFIQMINEGTLEYFDAETAAEAGLSYSTKKQVIRHKAEEDTSGGTGGLPYNASNDEGITIGGINLVMVTDKDYKEVLQIGFVKLKSVNRESPADQSGSMTVDFYFQKDMGSN